MKRQRARAGTGGSGGDDDEREEECGRLWIYVEGRRVVIIINLYTDSCSSDDTPRASRDREGVERDTCGPQPGTGPSRFPRLNKQRPGGARSECKTSLGNVSATASARYQSTFSPWLFRPRRYLARLPKRI